MGTKFLLVELLSNSNDVSIRQTSFFFKRDDEIVREVSFFFKRDDAFVGKAHLPQKKNGERSESRRTKRQQHWSVAKTTILLASIRLRHGQDRRRQGQGPRRPRSQ